MCRIRNVVHRRLTKFRNSSALLQGWPKTYGSFSAGDIGATPLTAHCHFLGCGTEHSSAPNRDTDLTALRI